jgi:hypothetical protein
MQRSCPHNRQPRYVTPVLLDPPRDKKALAILKLLPKAPTQVISLIVDLIRSKLQK